MVFCRALGPDRRDAVTALAPETRAWLDQQGFGPTEDGPWLEALTHGSFNGAGAGGAQDVRQGRGGVVDRQ